MRDLGTVVRGIRTPIIKENDDLANIVVESVLNASKNNGFEFNDRDVIAITEAVVGISEGNYVTVDQVSQDIKNKFNNPEELGIVFPILSRNRFSLILKGIARSTKKLYVQLSFPSDEVGNGILDEEKLFRSEFNMGSVLTEELIELGKYMSKKTLANLISCYQTMLPKALKASFKTNINKKYETYVELIDNNYILTLVNLIITLLSFPSPTSSSALIME